jgi:nitronate monooxygenase
MARRRFLDLIGAQVPIVQAPMAGAGGVDLCVGAIEGGALGSLPCALFSPDEVREQVAAVRRRAAGPINLNFFCHAMPESPDEGPWRALLRPYYEEFGVQPEPPGPLRMPFDSAMCETVEELRPEAVSFHFGLPEEALLRRVKQAGTVIIGNATTPEEARWLEVRGVDAVIAQGFEAGGHSGRFLGSDPAAALGLVALLPQVADVVSVPVIAAGGIGDGRGIAAAVALGASAVQLGTAYLHCPESLIRPEHRASLGEGGTIFTNLFTGGLARGAATRLVRELGPVRTEAPPYPLAAAALAPLKHVPGFAPMWAGQSAPLGRAIPAAELTRSLAADALAVLGRLF